MAWACSSRAVPHHSRPVRLSFHPPDAAGGRLEFSQGSIGLKGRYDRYHRRTDDSAALRVFQTTTIGVEYNPVRKVRIQVNYEFRDLNAPNAPIPAQQVADAMADRITTQVTASF